MTISYRFPAALLVTAGLAAGCGREPLPEVDAADVAFERATTAEAERYASASFDAARQARTTLDAELKAQDSRLFKSYDAAKELARGAHLAAVKAEEQAAAEKARLDRAAALKARPAAQPRIGGRLEEPVKLRHVAPTYPSLARRAKVGGTVVIEATIDRTGKVVGAEVVKSVPLLDDAALNAVKQWEYRPTRLNGETVPVVMTVNVDFVL